MNNNNYTSVSQTISSGDYHTQPQQGWECPRCGKINAPWISYCDCPRNNYTVTWNSPLTTFDPNTTTVKYDDIIKNHANKGKEK